MNEDFGIPDPEPQHRNRLSAAQTQAAKDRVEPRGDGFTYWTWNNNAPTYPTRREAEGASIQEWRNNL